MLTRIILVLITMSIASCKDRSTNVTLTEGNPYLSIFLDSISNSNSLKEKPMLIVDGKFINSYDKNSGWFLLRKNDIEKLEYMVDSSSIKLYGAHGKNGVILVKTNLPKYKSDPINEKSIYVLDGKVISYSEYKKIDFEKVSGIATITDKATILLYGTEDNEELIYVTTEITTE